MTGTGQSLKSRKLVGYLFLVLSVLATLALTTFMVTPEEIAKAGLWVIGAGGLFTIGGQALVDAVTRSKWSTPDVGTSTKTVLTETKVSP